MRHNYRMYCNSGKFFHCGLLGRGPLLVMLSLFLLTGWGHSQSMPVPVPPREASFQKAPPAKEAPSMPPTDGDHTNSNLVAMAPSGSNRVRLLLRRRHRTHRQLPSPRFLRPPIPAGAQEQILLLGGSALHSEEIVVNLTRQPASAAPVVITSTAPVTAKPASSPPVVTASAAPVTAKPASSVPVTAVTLPHGEGHLFGY